MRTGAKYSLLFAVIIFAATVGMLYIQIIPGLHVSTFNETIHFFLFMTWIGAIIGIVGSFIYWYNEQP